MLAFSVPMVACLLHLDLGALPAPLQAELLEGAAVLVARLHQQGAFPAVLLQCGSAADGAAGLAALRSAAEAAAAPLSLTQAGQLPVAVRLVLDQLAPVAPPAAVAFVSLADGPGCAAHAAAMRCGAVEHLPARGASAAQLQAWAMQAVACLAADRAPPPRPLLVGYVMKESRQLALSEQGMLPLLPTAPLPQAATAAASANGTATAAAATAAAAAAAAEPRLCFVPLDLRSSLAPQLARCQLLLQKLTDCLLPGGGGGVAAPTPEAAALLSLLEEQRTQWGAHQQAAAAGGGAAHAMPALPPCVVDPPAALAPVMDRALLIDHLEAAAQAVRQRGIPMRAPASLLVAAFDPAATLHALAAAGVALPCIAKPQAACGVAEAHQMAFVLHGSAFADLEVPLPAVVQEYVDHGGALWKVYCAGEQVFWTQRRSTPDLAPLARRLEADPSADLPTSIAFDSLKALPTSLPWASKVAAGGTADAAAGGGGAAAGQQAGALPGHELMRQPTFEAVAAALRARLGLTLFGFDLVFDRAAGELVIVDVNYFPSFKGIPEAHAALAAALRARYAQHLAAMQQQQR